MLRKIIEIDESRCDGCGDCIPSCAEGALAVVGGKVRLVREILCDGLGACLGTCDKGALRVVEREAAAFDAAAVDAHLGAARPASAVGPAGAGARRPSACPGSAPVDLGSRRWLRVVPSEADPAPPPRPRQGGSELSHWPVQLHLVPPTAPWLRDADLLVAADCVPFAYARFHQDLLAGKRLVIGCPKLDDLQRHLTSLTEILRGGTVRSVTVAMMEVPCCSGLAAAARQAVAFAGREIPYREVTIGIDGGLAPRGRGRA